MYPSNKHTLRSIATFIQNVVVRSARESSRATALTYLSEPAVKAIVPVNEVVVPPQHLATRSM